MASKKIQLYTDRDKTIEASPETSANCVILSDGNDLQKVLDNDLTNPTVVHEETSFKVGVGDIDVSSSVVDGEVGRMVIKGKTYQNILPEPSTHVLTNNKEMFKVNEGLDPNVEVVDAVSKSAILKGQTLVNLCVDASEKTIGYSSSTSSKYDYRETLKPNTTYTILFKISDFDENVGNVIEVSLNSGYKTYQTISNNGRHSITFTTQSDTTKYTSLWFYILGAGAITGKTSDIIVLEGDYANLDVPFFTGMQSVKMPVLTTTGNNLLDANYLKEQCLKISSSATYTDGNIVFNSNAFHQKRLIALDFEPNTQYAFNFKMSGKQGSQLHIMVYYTDSTKTFHIPYIADWTDTISGITKANATVDYITISYGNGASGCVLYVNECSLFKSNTVMPHEPYKSNILSTPEEVALRGIGDVQDTLNCLTGEVVERIGEIELVNREWIKNESFLNPVYGTTIDNLFFDKDGNSMCDKLSRIPYDNRFNIEVGQYYTTADRIYVGHNNMSVSEFKSYIDRLSPKLQYQLKTPVVKTVDLSSSGNWEKVVLDGSEDESWGDGDNGLSKTHRFYVRIPNLLSGNHSPIIDSTYFTPIQTGTSSQDTPCVQIASNNIYFRIERQIADSLTSFKTWLQQNPLTVWYPTATHQDSTQVKQPIFFKDGHVQLSSGADNSLIPTLDYQAKTSNSYVMDLMKTNTKYTMKAKSANGTFTIDGTSYGAGTNGTFTTPSSMTNKLLVMSNKTNTEVMILEGDVTSKTIPYFKGIKSAFEGEDKIEVLSTGKNLTHHILGGNPESKEYNFMNIIETHKNTSGALNRAKVIKWVEKDKFFIKGYGIDQYDNQYNIDLTPTVLKPNTTYFISFESIEGSHEQQEDMKLTLGTFNVWLNNTRVIRAYEGGTYTFTTPSQVDSFNLNLWLDGTKNKNATIYAIFNKFMITEGKSIDEGYEPHKSNNTKIPLLSPLRSLPNGVCDELIIDRMKKKATLVQRVGVGFLDGTQGISTNISNVDTNLYQPFFCGDVFGNMAIVPHNVVTIRCDKLLACSSSTTYRSLTTNAIYQYTDSSARLAGQITKKDLGVKSVRDWFRANPTTIYYQLATPVVTEIDLENFPLVYKDGHIFLNSEIAPVVEIDYNVNQSQQIQANNETLQRHELDILDLDNLIVSFVNAEYNLRLLKFDMELSMTALAE